MALFKNFYATEWQPSYNTAHIDKVNLQKNVLRLECHVFTFATLMEHGQSYSAVLLLGSLDSLQSLSQHGLPYSSDLRTGTYLQHVVWPLTQALDGRVGVKF